MSDLWDANGFDTRWTGAINTALEDRNAPVRLDAVTYDLWDRYLGPMLDEIERAAETRAPTSRPDRERPRLAAER